MTLGSAEEEIARFKALSDRQDFKELRDQMEEDFGNLGAEEFKMPEAEGTWDSVTTNSASNLANKIKSILSSSSSELYIDMGDETKLTKAEREKFAATERLANGCLWLADIEATTVPSRKKLQEALASDAVDRGGTAKSVYWVQEDKKPVCHITRYDPFGCRWIEGDDGIVWFGYQDSLTEDQVKYSYKKLIKDGWNYGEPNTDGTIPRYTFWDDEQWKMAIGGEWLEDEGEKHNLGYIPIYIRSCGPSPYRQSEKYKNTMKWSWQSYAMNTRNVYKLMSRLLSILSTKATDSGRTTIVAAYDSQLSDGKMPDLTKADFGAGQRNVILYLDKAKGIEFKGFVEAPGSEAAETFLNRVRGEMDIMASIDPIASGIMTRGGSGALAAELKSATLEFINFARECVEEDKKWMAWECVRQFKNGKFEQVSVEGRDRKQVKFYVNIKPEDVVEKRFECKLVADRLRDKIQEQGAQIEAIKYGLKSVETAMMDGNIVPDPDAEKEKMRREWAEREMMKDPVYRHQEMAKFYEDKGDKEMALHHYNQAKFAIIAETKQLSMMMGGMPQNPEETMGEEGNKPPIISGDMQAAGIAAQPGQIIETPEVGQ